VNSVDVDDVADDTELPRDEVDLVLDVLVVVVGKLPHSVLRVGVDEH